MACGLLQPGKGSKLKMATRIVLCRIPEEDFDCDELTLISRRELLATRHPEASSTTTQVVTETTRPGKTPEPHSSSEAPVGQEFATLAFTCRG